MDPEPIDPARAERLARGRAERECNLEITTQVRQALIAGAASPQAAAQALTAEADHCVQAMLQIAMDSMSADFGPPPGRFTVLGLGKFGGCELTLGSDLDVVFIYEPADEAQNVDPADYFVRLGQRLIRELYWTTDWQALYEVDVRLRPHGEDGPLATPLAGLTDYLLNDCWIWELQALTRLRPIAGDAGLARRVKALAQRAMAVQSGRADLLDQIAGMRALMEQERPGRDRWDLKLTAGGLVDIEFIVQALSLQRATGDRAIPAANTGAALHRLGDEGALPPRAVRTLHRAWALYSAVRQIQGALGVDDLSRTPARSWTKIAGLLGFRSAGALQARLFACQANVRRLFEDLVGDVRPAQAA